MDNSQKSIKNSVNTVKTVNSIRKKSNFDKVKKAHRKNKTKNRFFAAMIVFVLLVLIVWILYNKLFIVAHFQIKGEKEYTTEQADFTAFKLGLEKGIHMFGFNKEKAAEKAKYLLTEFDSLKIEYALPNKIIFSVKEASPVMYISFNDDIFILSESLRIISRTNDASYAEQLALKRVYLSGVKKCVAGEFLDTENGTSEILKELYAVLKEEGIIGDISEINITNKFDISFLYKSRFTVKLGGNNLFSQKILFMKEIEKNLYDTQSGYIDISSDELREGIFKPY